MWAGAPKDPERRLHSPSPSVRRHKSDHYCIRCWLPVHSRLLLRALLQKGAWRCFHFGWTTFHLPVFLPYYSAYQGWNDIAKSERRACDLPQWCQNCIRNPSTSHQKKIWYYLSSGVQRHVCKIFRNNRRKNESDLHELETVEHHEYDLSHYLSPCLNRPPRSSPGMSHMVKWDENHNVAAWFSLSSKDLHYFTVIIFVIERAVK